MSAESALGCHHQQQQSDVWSVREREICDLTSSFNLQSRRRDTHTHAESIEMPRTRLHDELQIIATLISGKLTTFHCMQKGWFMFREHFYAPARREFHRQLHCAVHNSFSARHNVSIAIATKKSVIDVLEIISC